MKIWTRQNLTGQVKDHRLPRKAARLPAHGLLPSECLSEVTQRLRRNGKLKLTRSRIDRDAALAQACAVGSGVRALIALDTAERQARKNCLRSGRAEHRLYDTVTVCTAALR
jgi:hypothetical protein